MWYEFHLPQMRYFDLDRFIFLSRQSNLMNMTAKISSDFFQFVHINNFTGDKLICVHFQNFFIEMLHTFVKFLWCSEENVSDVLLIFNEVVEVISKFSLMNVWQTINRLLKIIPCEYHCVHNRLNVCRSSWYLCS